MNRTYVFYQKNNMNQNAIHIVADLYGCDFTHYVAKHTLPEIVTDVESIIEKNGFSILGTLQHSFGEHAFSIVCMLCESHVSIHTWPETGYVSFDIHTCNYSADNTAATHRISEAFILMFQPRDVSKQVLERATDRTLS
jgi:S-adenosylmethionine decarboxylase